MALRDVRGWSRMAAAGAARLLASVVLSSQRVEVTPAPAPPGGEGEGEGEGEGAGAARAPRARPPPRLAGGVWVMELVQSAAEPSASRAPRPAAARPAGGRPAGAQPAGAPPAGAAAPARVLGAGRARAGGASLGKIPAAIRRGPIPGAPARGGFDYSSGGNAWVPRMIRVPLAEASGRTDDPAALAAGTFSDEVTAEELAASDDLGRTRALAVKAAMQVGGVGWGGGGGRGGAG